MGCFNKTIEKLQTLNLDVKERCIPLSSVSAFVKKLRENSDDKLMGYGIKVKEIHDEINGMCLDIKKQIVTDSHSPAPPDHSKSRISLKGGEKFLVELIDRCLDSFIL